MPETISETRMALLDAAERLFSARGYASVGIREIAEQADANLASINYHFGSKRELYLETVRRVMARSEHGGAWARLHEEARDPLTAARCLHGFIRAYLHDLLVEGGHDSCGALMLWEAVQPSEAIDAVVRDYIEPSHAALLALVRALLPADDRDRARLCARSVLGQLLHYRVFGPFIERLDARGDDPQQTAGEKAEHVLRFSLRAMGHDDAFIDRVLLDAETSTDTAARSEEPVP